MRQDSNVPSSPVIDFDSLIEQAKRDRTATMGETLSALGRLMPITTRDVGVAVAASAIWVAVFAATSLTASRDSAATPTASAVPALASPAAASSLAASSRATGEDRSSFERAYATGGTYQYWPCGDPACDQ